MERLLRELQPEAENIQGVAPASELIVVKDGKSEGRWISKDNRIDAGSRLCDQESGGVSNADCS